MCHWYQVQCGHNIGGLEAPGENGYKEAGFLIIKSSLKISDGSYLWEPH